MDNKENLPGSKPGKIEAQYKRKVTGLHSDYVSTNGETADDIINQHLIEEEQNLRSNFMDSKYKDHNSGKKSDKEEDYELYEDDPEFEKIANNDDEERAKNHGSDKDDSSDYIDDSLNFNQKSPKQTLIEHLRLLSDIFNSSISDGNSEYYDQIFDERAQFLLDFENILKIMTFDETIEYILPCL